MKDPRSPFRCKQGAAGLFVEMADVLETEGFATSGKRRITMSLFNALLSFGMDVEISVSSMTRTNEKDAQKCGLALCAFSQTPRELLIIS